MAAPGMDPNAAPPPPAGGLDELFEDLDDVDDDLHAHARACGDEEKKEAVHLDDSTLVGLLPKKLNEKQLDAPTAVVELSMNGGGSACRAGVRPPR